MSWGELGSELRGLDSSESELSLEEEERSVVVVVVVQKRTESTFIGFECRELQSLLESVAMEEEVDIFRVANGYGAQFLSGFLRVFGWAA